MMFQSGSSSSQVVPQDVFNNSTSVLSHMVFFAQNSTPMYITSKGVCCKGRTLFISILQLGVQRGAFIVEFPQCPKKISDGPINMAPSREKKKSVSGAPMN